GDGAGGFSAPRWFMAAKHVSFLEGVDLDGDGVVDLVGLSWNTETISVLRGGASPPAGVASFGAGTPGCTGVLGLSASLAPHVGAASFGWKCTNAPASSVGLLLVGDAADLAGSDPLGVGVALHVDLLASSALFALACPSDVGGSAFAPAPIPNDPSLAGATLVAQALFVQPAWLACGPSPLGLVASKGATIVVQP
ncbi:MAG TPA: hypothetical protein VKE69_03460, partial [Planctomycetota bacterium]|nr:hypothetical protein [Planctomycetota bacterium]